MSVNERWLEILLTPLRDGITVADTCRRYGVSRQSFYDYRRRLNTEGASALQPRSRRPHTSPRQTDPVVEARIVAMRTENPRWGARFWMFLNVVVWHQFWVFGWCSVGFDCCAHGCFGEDRILLCCLSFRRFVFSGCFAILGCVLYDWEHDDDELAGARERGFVPPPHLPSLVRVLGTGFTGTTKFFGENANSGI